MVDATFAIDLLAIGGGSVIAAMLLLVYYFQQRKNKKAGVIPVSSTGAKLSKVMPPRITPEVRVVAEIPGGRTMSDGTGRFLWFWICVAAIITAPILLGISGVSIIVVVAYFGLFPIVGVVGGYMFARFRVTQPARDFDKMLKQSSGIGLHIGTDDKARLVGARRGSTGRWHFPNMEITADAIRKAIFPFYGNVLSIIHSVTDSQLNPEFLYYATVFNRNSELIGEDGRPKLSHEIADAIQNMIDREEELMEMQEQLRRIENGETTLSQVLFERYGHLIYPKMPQDMTVDDEALNKLTAYWKGMMDDDGWAMKVELAEIERGLQITVEEKGYHVEYEKDMRGRLIGAHLVHDRVIDLHDFRNYLPTGGTAESSHLQSENARMAGIQENGVSQAQYMRWLLLIMTPVMVGVMVAIVAYALKSL